MENAKSIQQVLRPTDTCVFAIHGQLLGVPAPSPRLCAIVKHEGTSEHALFLFEVAGSRPSLQFSLDRMYHIRGSFKTSVQENRGGRCKLLINMDDGTSILLDLPSGSSSQFVQHLNTCLSMYVLNQSRSPNAFQWLRGYDACRTGWDRFSKPSVQDGSQQGKEGGYQTTAGSTTLPDMWPWSHIITPNSDGATAVATCELLEDFDPLLANNKPAPKPSLQQQQQPLGNFPSSMGLLADLTQPSDMRHCISDSNLFELEEEAQMMWLKPSNNTGSEAQLTTIGDFANDVFCLLPPAIQDKRSTMVSAPPAIQDKRSTMVSAPPCLNIFDLEGTKPASSPVVAPPTVSTSAVPEPAKPVLQVVEDIDQSGTTGDGNSGRRSRSSTDWQASECKLPVAVVTEDTPLPRGEVKRPGSVIRRPHKDRGPYTSRYRPGVPLLKGPYRDSIIQVELQKREVDFCQWSRLRVFCGTWNVNGQLAPYHLDEFLLDFTGSEYSENPTVPELYAIGFQELDLSAQCLISNESNREDMWREAIEVTLKKKGNFVKVHSVRLVGIFLLVYIKKELSKHITEVVTEYVETGLHGLMGNKGGVGIRFNYQHTSFCFVNCHLAAHTELVEKRNQDFNTIMEKMCFQNNILFPYTILEHDIIIWMGDMNYRLQLPAEMHLELVRGLADNYQLHQLLKYDQLILEKEKGNVFKDFIEEKIEFKPTYKYGVGTNTWDSSEKNRFPAWCDRVLYYKTIKLKPRGYGSHPSLLLSDHKPVSSLYDAVVKVVIPEKEKTVLEEITWKLDRLENDFLPQVEIGTTEFVFNNVKFGEAQSQQFVAINVGQRAVHVSFTAKPDSTAIFKPWMDIKPPSILIQPSMTAVFVVTVLVDENSAAALTKANGQFDDIMVLHLEGGKDFFISVSGTYLVSCFGSSLETLVNLHTFIREVPVAKLVDLSMSCEHSHDKPQQRSTTSPPAHDIPRELFLLVNHLREHGMTTANLFTDGGLQSELVEIRDMLDSGGSSSQLPGSVYSVAAALLSFLQALSEPVVPYRLHTKCMDCCNAPILCRQVLQSQMDKIHSRAFIFIITFLKELLQKSDRNELDPKLLASIFGTVLLRAPPEETNKTKRAQVAMERKAATFIYQFLVNDLTTPYR